MKIKKWYLRYRVYKRKMTRKAIQNIGDLLVQSCMEAPNEKIFWFIYDMCIQFHWVSLFIFDYQLK